MTDQQDPFEGIVFDEDFVKGGVHEPPARTREAFARYQGQQTSWRQAGPQSPTPIRRRPSARLHRVLGMSWIFVLLVTIFIGSAVASWQTTSRLAVFGMVMGGWLISLCLHEFGHAAVAYVAGDQSVDTKGYLRLDIRRYAHPVLSFVIPALFVLIGGIGFPGGAVWIDQNALRTRRWRSLTSLAGPSANLVCAVACLLPFRFIGTGQDLGSHIYFWSALAFLGLLQLWALFINLLPIPGLDGWGALEPYLRSDIVAAARRVSPFVIMIVFFIVMSSPSVNGHIVAFLDGVAGRFDVPPILTILGNHLMRFWSNG